MKKPVFIVLAGPNGSGKSTLAQFLKTHEWGRDTLFLNADFIAEEFGSWNDEACVRRAQAECIKRLHQAIREHRNIMYESVFSHESKIDIVNKALQEGYFCRFFFISTESPDINLERVSIRVSESGHDVPQEKIKSRYQRSFMNAAVAMRMVQRGYCYDNSTPASENSGFELKPLFRTVDGKLKKIYKNPTQWPTIFSMFLKNICNDEEI